MEAKLCGSGRLTSKLLLSVVGWPVVGGAGGSEAIVEFWYEDDARRFENDPVSPGIARVVDGGRRDESPSSQSSRLTLRSSFLVHRPAALFDGTTSVRPLPTRLTSRVYPCLSGLILLVQLHHSLQPLPTSPSAPRVFVVDPDHPHLLLAGGSALHPDGSYITWRSQRMDLA